MSDELLTVKQSEPMRRTEAFGYFLSLASYVLWALFWTVLVHEFGIPQWVGILSALSAAIPQALTGFRGLRGSHLPEPPEAPVLREPRRGHESPQPARTIREPADTCEICGRRLTTYESQLNRVGTTCVKTYGTREKYVPNPAHGKWLEESARLDVALAAARASAAVQHASDLASFHRATEDWRARMSSPEIVATVARLREAKINLRQALLGLLLSLVVFLFAAFLYS